jgi:MerR family transcriptional regulator, thiopeptide resistance regulator
MLLSVGEVARRCGITVRTLHHYDAIGLLKPSVRSAAGYRCYDQANLERLHRIQALRRSGMSLADIGNLLSGVEVPLAEVIDRQIAQIDQEVALAIRLREHLIKLRASIATGQPPDLATWLDTLELMSMYETHFSKEELKQLPLHENPSATPEWSALVKDLKSVMDHGGSPGDPEAQQLAFQWVRMLERDTGGNADFFARLDQINRDSPEVREATGITDDMRSFVKEAIADSRLRLYAKYLEPQELAYMREHYVENMDAWPSLVAGIQREMASGTPPDGQAMKALALQWIEHFRNFAGDDPATHARIRHAHAQEPALNSGFANKDLIEYIQQALASLKN